MGTIVSPLFKAANPAACLADFVRWHSPRDWIEPDAAEEEGNQAAPATGGKRGGVGRGLHSSTFRLNVSTFLGIWINWSTFRFKVSTSLGIRWVPWVELVTETAKVDLKIGRV